MPRDVETETGGDGCTWRACCWSGARSEKPGAAKAKAIDVVRSWPRPEIDKLKRIIRNGLSLFIDRLLIVGQ